MNPLSYEQYVRQLTSGSPNAALSAIVYRSRAIEVFSDIDLFYLLAHARENNAKLGISGIVLYDRGYFYQWIEGHDEQLGRVWNAIRADPRHTDVQVLVDQQIPTRLFAGWSMQFAHRDRQHEPVVDGFVVADTALLDDLHLNSDKVPNILAAFGKLAARNPERREDEQP